MFKHEGQFFVNEELQSSVYLRPRMWTAVVFNTPCIILNNSHMCLSTWLTHAPLFTVLPGKLWCGTELCIIEHTCRLCRGHEPLFHSSRLVHNSVYHAEQMHRGGEARCVAGHMFQYGTSGKRVEFTRQCRRIGVSRPSEGPELCVTFQLDRLRLSFVVCLTSLMHFKSKVIIVKYCGVGSYHLSRTALTSCSSVKFSRRENVYHYLLFVSVNTGLCAWWRSG